MEMYASKNNRDHPEDIGSHEMNQDRAPKTYLDNTWKQFVEGIKKLPVQDDGNVSCGKLLANLIKEKTELFGDSEDQSQLHTGMLMPVMPYEAWIPNMFPWMDNSKKEKFRLRHHQSLEPEERNWMNLNAHLSQLGSDFASRPFTNSDNALKMKMEDIFEHVVASLRTDFKLFEDCILHYTGSVYEGLKIGELDEFDFMIEIPALLNVISFKRGIQHQSIKLTLKDDSILSDIPIVSIFEPNSKGSCSMESVERVKSHNYEQITKEEDSNSISSSTSFTAATEESNDSNEIHFILALKSLGVILKDRIEQFLPNNWKVTEKKTVASEELSLLTMYSQKSAFTYNLDANGENVSVDVALTVPVYDLALVSNYEGVIGSKPGNFQQQVQKRQTVHHVIIRNANTCRITFSIQEKAIMNRYDYNDPRKLCIRLLKYFRDMSTVHLKLPEKEASPILNSYHIKTLFYFLFSKYKLDTDWSMETLGPRLLEAVLSLKKCFENSMLESYFIPHYNVLRYVKFQENTSSKMDDLKLLQTQLDSIYQILVDSNETKDGYTKLINYFDAMRSTVIRHVSSKEEYERSVLAFICSNFK